MIVPFLGLRWKTRVTRVMTPLPLGNFYASKALTPALSRRKRGSFGPLRVWPKGASGRELTEQGVTECRVGRFVMFGPGGLSEIRKGRRGADKWAASGLQSPLAAPEEVWVCCSVEMGR